jgi:hypothetical protein
MPQLLHYLRKKLAPRHGVHFGRVSCNRVYISVAIFLVYILLIAPPPERDRPEFLLKLDFMVKRIIPYVCTLLAGYGLYYGVLGFFRDQYRGRAIFGVLMNFVCLIFHGILMYLQTKEFFLAYWYDHGQIMTQFR